MMREVSIETLPNVNIRDPSHDKNLLIMSVTGSINQNVFKLYKLFLGLKVDPSRWQFLCYYCEQVTTVSAPLVQANCPQEVLLKAILNIPDISKLIASSSFRTKIIVPYPCPYCKKHFDVKLIVYCDGIVRRSQGAYSKISRINTIAPIHILSWSEHVKQTWDDVIQDVGQRLYKCKKGHTTFLT